MRVPSELSVFVARRRRAARWGGRSDAALAILVIGTLGAAAFRLLALTFVVFQHAYLNSYAWIPGARAANAYWASVRFAFQTTVCVSIAIGLLVALLVVELRRTVWHR